MSDVPAVRPCGQTGGGEGEHVTGKTGCLRGLPQPIAGEPLLGEDLHFDIEGDDLGGPVGPINRAAAVDIARPLAIERHVRPPVVVPVGEVVAQPLQVGLLALSGEPTGWPESASRNKMRYRLRESHPVAASRRARGGPTAAGTKTG